MSRLVVIAFGIHTGGSYVLLEALMRAARGCLKRAWVDARAFERLAAIVPADVLTTVPSTLVARVAALRAAPRDALAGDRLLGFNSLPPLARSAAPTIVYVHAPYLAGDYRAFAYTRRQRARFRVERALLAAGRFNADRFWVQTPSSAAALAARVEPGRIEVVSFIDDALRIPAPHTISPARAGALFIYPADAVAHKNHTNLFRAWALLAGQGVRPPLIVTLRADEFARRLEDAGFSASDLPHVTSLRFARDAMLDAIRAADAMIFPSRAETFGIPYLEATMLGTPILAAEADFVRDVCVPAQTFDATSPRSIADAVLRFMGMARPTVVPLNAQAFVAKIFAMPPSANAR